MNRRTLLKAAGAAVLAPVAVVLAKVLPARVEPKFRMTDCVPRGSVVGLDGETMDVVAWEARYMGPWMDMRNYKMVTVVTTNGISRTYTAEQWKS